MPDIESIKQEAEELRNILEKVRTLFHSNQSNISDYKKNWEEMVSKAEILHKNYTVLFGKVPHKSSMIKNRGYDPDKETRNFYNHIHPVEDLINYALIKSISMTPSSTNQNISNVSEQPKEDKNPKIFKLEIFSNRWKHSDFYKLTWNKTGWYIEFLAINGQCDITGTPYLFKNLEHDFISYPNDLGFYMEFLWTKINNAKINQEEIQKAFNDLSKWIIMCEKNAPREEFWSGLK